MWIKLFVCVIVYLCVVLCQGPGLLVSDDDTALHGEFSDDWTVNGKVRKHPADLILSVLSTSDD